MVTIINAHEQYKLVCTYTYIYMHRNTHIPPIAVSATIKTKKDKAQVTRSIVKVKHKNAGNTVNFQWTSKKSFWYFLSTRFFPPNLKMLL